MWKYHKTRVHVTQGLHHWRQSLISTFKMSWNPYSVEKMRLFRVGSCLVKIITLTQLFKNPCYSHNYFSPPFSGSQQLCWEDGDFCVVPSHLSYGIWTWLSCLRLQIFLMSWVTSPGKREGSRRQTESNLSLSTPWDQRKNKLYLFWQMVKGRGKAQAVRLT